MNVFLLTDLEGIAGVDSIEAMDRSRDEYRKAARCLEHTINLAVKTCFESGAETVYYRDAHGGGGNADLSRIDPRAVHITIPQWSQLLMDGKIDCVIEIGAHARAGTIGGFLDHTLNSKEIFSITANGVEMSELSLHALLCTVYGVPICGITGDEAACRQAREYIPNIVTGAVKAASTRNAARTYENADEILCSTVRRSLAHYQEVSLLSYTLPITMRRTYYRTDYCEKILAWNKPCVTRIDARTLEITIAHIQTYGDLWVTK